ncbi:MAG: hypothetical protein ABIS86_15245 [Streptosporangiaceae bacterium]
MSRHRSAPGHRGPIVMSMAVMGVVVALGIVGGYTLYRGLANSAGDSPAPAPTRIVQRAEASPSPLVVKAPNAPCHLVILDRDRNSIIKDLEPSEIYEFQEEEFQGTVCAGAEVYVNGVRQTPTPIPSQDSGSFAN